MGVAVTAVAIERVWQLSVIGARQNIVAASGTTSTASDTTPTPSDTTLPLLPCRPSTLESSHVDNERIQSAKPTKKVRPETDRQTDRQTERQSVTEIGTEIDKRETERGRETEVVGLTIRRSLN